MMVKRKDAGRTKWRNSPTRCEIEKIGNLSSRCQRERGGQWIHGRGRRHPQTNEGWKAILKRACNEQDGVGKSSSIGSTTTRIMTKKKGPKNQRYGLWSLGSRCWYMPKSMRARIVCRSKGLMGRGGHMVINTKQGEEGGLLSQKKMGDEAQVSSFRARRGPITDFAQDLPTKCEGIIRLNSSKVTQVP